MYTKNEVDYMVKVLGIEAYIRPEGASRPEAALAQGASSQAQEPAPDEQAGATHQSASQASERSIEASPSSAGPTSSIGGGISSDFIEEPHPPLFEASGDPKAPLVVFFTEKPMGPEATLLKKMLAAMKVKRVYMILSKQTEGIESGRAQVQWGLVRKDFTAPLGLIFGREDFAAVMGPEASYEASLGQVREQGGVRWLVTHGVKDMTQAGSPERQVQVKKETWTHLQTLIPELP